MRSWTDRFRDGGGTGAGELAAFCVELSFRIEDGTFARQRERRLALVIEALKEIARTDERLQTWEIHRSSDPNWIRIQAVVAATQPGEVAALSEAWMRSAIAASNLAVATDSAAVPSPREAGWGERSLSTITAQVMADV